MSRHFETEMKDDIEQSIQILVNSRKSYKCVKQIFHLKTDQIYGQNLFFF